LFTLAAAPLRAADVEATTQPSSPAAQSAATTQPSEVAAAAAAAAVAAIDARDENRSITDTFRNTQVGQLFEGKRKVTLDDVKSPAFWIETVRDFVIAIVAFIPRILVALLFLVVFYGIYRAVRKIVVGSMKKANVDPSIRDMLGFLIKWAIMGFGIVIACNQIGIQIAALLTGVSIIGLAVGFAAQETLANFIAGIVIFLDKPFKIGDWIEIDGQLAEVKRVTFRSTRLENLDNDVVIIPNTMVLSQKFLNKSTNQITRASVPIGIAYKESIDEARGVLLGLVENDRRIVKCPAAIVEVRSCSASSVDLMLHFWIKEEAYEDAMIWEYLERAKKALDAAGIEIPFPPVQVLMEDTPAIQLLSGALRKAG
jgi:small conductance mechanosensitive channel